MPVIGLGRYGSVQVRSVCRGASAVTGTAVFSPVQDDGGSGCEAEHRTDQRTEHAF